MAERAKSENHMMRFPADLWSRVEEHVSKITGATPTTWIRQVVAQRLDQEAKK